MKEGSGGRLQGFGHRVYKSYDPRAKIIKKTADEVFEITGKNPLLDIALKLEEIALSDDYFISRKLYPNVDFYSGLIYQAMGFPLEMFPVLFAIPRTAGWLAHWQEMLDQDSKIARPRQLYIGDDARDYVPDRRPLSGVVRPGRDDSGDQGAGPVPPETRISPSWATDTTSSPPRVNRNPRASPRAPEAIGLSMS